MRRFLSLLTVPATLLALSCNSELIEVRSDSSPQTLTVQAVIGDCFTDGPETRTVITNEDTRRVAWCPGDRISLFYGSGNAGGSEFVSTTETNATVTNFTGTIGVITGGADISVDQTYFWGLYPYDPEAYCDGTSIVTTLSPDQTAVAGTFATGIVLSMARSQNLGLSFYNVCSGLRVKVSKEGVVRMTLKSLDGTPLAGKARISFDSNGSPVVEEVLDGSDEIVLSAPAGKYLEPGQNYYFMFFPHNFSESYFTVTFETMTETATYERKRPMNFARSNIEGFNVALDQSLTYTSKEGSIPIEDPAFKGWLVQNGFDSDGDGEISYSEAESIRDISISYTNDINLQSLQGIEYMPNLEILRCDGEWYDTGSKLEGVERQYYYIGPYADNWESAWGPIGTLRYVDVTYNPKLIVLSVSCNSALGENIETLDLSNNPLLEELNLGFTYTYYPDISSCSRLRSVELSHSRGGVKPDLSNKPLLENLCMDWPQDARYIQSYDIDVSGCPLLTRMLVANSARSISDLSNNPLLKELIIWSLHSSVSGIGSLADLEILRIEDSGLNELDLSNCTELSVLDCNGNNLNSLDLSKNTQLKSLDCIGNNISSLRLPNGLETLRCWSNPLGTLDVSNLTDLIDLACADTGLSELNVTNNTKLVRLAFNDNQISSIDLSANPDLEEIACWNCGLSTLDLSNNPKLTWVRCWENNLTVLDVSHNLALGNRETTSQYSGDNGLYCCQNYDEYGVNLLKTLYIAEGQVIPFINDGNRSDEHIPSTTSVQVAPPSGGGEGYGGGEQDP